MRQRTYVWLGIVALGVAIGAVFGPALHEREPERTAPAPAIRSQPASASDSTAPEQVAASPIPPPPEAAREETVTAQSNDRTFRVNDSGRLVLDEQTRLNVEALFARTGRAQLAAAKQQAVEVLPAGAAAQAAEILDEYDNYQQAQRQAYPPGVAPTTEEAALAELDGLHALRAAHFGPVIARALYGEEEALSRQLIELMRLEKDQSLTMEEKAARAQQLRDSMPEVAEVERRNREDPR